MRNSVMKALTPSIIKPLIESVMPGGKTTPDSEQGDFIREHILLGGVSETGRSAALPDTDTGSSDTTAAGRSNVGNNLKQFGLGAAGETTEQAAVPPKPLEIDTLMRDWVLQLDGNYILGTNDDDNVLMGSLEADKIFSFDGDDRIQSLHGNDTIYAGNGDDSVNGGLDDDLIFGGNGNDNLSGSVGNDIIHGDDGDDYVSGGDGDDQLYGGIGDDEMSGGDGNDEMYGWNGRDTMDGGNGNDLMLGAAGNDVMHGGAGQDKMDGGYNNDRMYGDEGDDTLEGGHGHDRLDGGNDNDVLDGGAGIDALYGGNGNDLLSGGANDDITPWGDYLTGGAGTDVFWFEMGESGGDTSMDVIWDFSQGFDQLAFVNNEVNTLFLGEANGFTNAPGAQAYFEHTTNDFGDVTIMHVRDTNGLESDIDVIIKGHHNLTMDDMAFG